MSRVLVTGGGGFIGAMMVEHLIQDHPEMTVRTMDLNNTHHQNVETVNGSILDVNSISEAVHGCDLVIHMAAMLGVRRTEIKRMECLNINIQGTVNLMDACAKERVQKVLFISSSEVYGEPRESPIQETTPLNPKSIYAVSKLAGEEYVKAYSEKYGFDYSIVRFFNIYGPRQVPEFVIPRFVRAALEGKPLTVYGTGDQVRTFCYVTDAVRGAAAVLLKDASNGEIFNIGNDVDTISIKALASKIVALSERDVEIQFVPMNKSDRDPSREIQNRLLDLTKAREMLNYELNIGLDDGIKRVMDTWFDVSPNREQLDDELIQG